MMTDELNREQSLGIAHDGLENHVLLEELEPTEMQLEEAFAKKELLWPRNTALLRPEDVSEWLSLSIRQIRRLCANQQFPMPLKIGGRSIRWRVKDIKKFIKNRVAQSNILV